MSRDAHAREKLSLAERSADLCSEPRAWCWELVRFGTVGGLSVLGYALTMLLLADSGIEIAIATAPAYLVSMVFNYMAQKLWTFRSKAPLIRSVPRYLAVHVVGIGINSGVVALLIHGLSVPFLPAQAIAIGLVAMWSYSVQKCWVFVE